MTQAIAPSAVIPGLPCRACQGSGAAGCFTDAPCTACGGRGQGSAVRLPFGLLAEITPGLAGWAWTVLRGGTPVDGGVQATEQAALDAVTNWFGAEEDRIADRLAYAVLLTAFAEFGYTGTACAAAFAAVALTDAIEES